MSLTTALRTRQEGGKGRPPPARQAPDMGIILGELPLGVPLLCQCAAVGECPSQQEGWGRCHMGGCQ